MGKMYGVLKAMDSFTTVEGVIAVTQANSNLRQDVRNLTAKYLKMYRHALPALGSPDSYDTATKCWNVYRRLKGCGDLFTLYKWLLYRSGGEHYHMPPHVFTMAREDVANVLNRYGWDR